MNTLPPPPPATADQTTTIIPLPTAAAISNPPSSSSNNDDVSQGILITVLILAIAVILSASLYLLLRFLRRRNHHHTPTTTTTTLPLHNHNHTNKTPTSSELKNPLIDSLPQFPFTALTGTIADADCAVCLSRFEPTDSLRLLPICCHAFHVDCIDTWLSTNQSCPLCRSPIFIPHHSFSSSSSFSSSGSFRVEMGNISRRQPDSSTDNNTNNNNNNNRRTYSISGSYDYILDDAVSEVPVGSFGRTSSSEVKTSDHVAAQDHLANEVGTRGGGWLKDYLSSSSSRTASFRGGSGRWFFTGSSRRTADGVTGNRGSFSEVDLEASQLGDEIGELFRWLSGV